MRTARISLPVLVGIAALLAVALARTGEIRDRAEAGLGAGMPAREAALARGFVLGEDEGVDAGDEGRLHPRRPQPPARGQRLRTSPCWRCWRSPLLGGASACRCASACSGSWR